MGPAGSVVSFLLVGRRLALAGQEKFWKAGLAKADVTPSERLWMAGYASRETNLPRAKLMSTLDKKSLRWKMRR